MAITAKIKYLRIAPRKMRLVADLIRGKSAKEAKNLLHFTIKKGTQDFLKLLDSAISAAKNNLHIEESALYIKKLTVDEGPKLKRWMPRARGQATPLQLKTSHINLILEEIKGNNLKGKDAVGEADQPVKSEKSPRADKAAEKPRFKQERGMPKPKTEREARKIFKRQVF
ncbi:MAG: 50S ribosomal protein L22 [Candidatus Wildermuthbacteria bacterium]|nr:50S ribosomal protein L22 [Candidatus Wildermuthbacteria bacterium]